MTFNNIFAKIKDDPKMLKAYIAKAQGRIDTADIWLEKIRNPKDIGLDPELWKELDSAVKPALYAVVRGNLLAIKKRYTEYKIIMEAQLEKVRDNNTGEGA